MDKAKTIDLCNNPLTKAPKLEIAQKRIPEWPKFDELARNISAGSDEYQKQVKALKADREVKDKLLKEIDRLKGMPGGSQEGNVIRTYIETLLELPWKKVV